MDALNGLLSFLREENILFKASKFHLKYNSFDSIILENKNLVIIYITEWNTFVKHDLLHIKLSLLRECIDLIYIHKDFISYKLDIIISKLKSIFQLNNIIYARKTQIVHLSHDQADIFINNNDLLNSCSAKYKIGLKYNNELVMVALFSKKKVINRNNIPFNSYELIRITGIKKFNIIGGINKILGYFVNTYKPDDIMTYIDLNWYRSNSFSKLNFKLVGITCNKISNKEININSLRNINIGSIKFIRYIKPL